LITNNRVVERYVLNTVRINPGTRHSNFTEFPFKHLYDMAYIKTIIKNKKEIKEEGNGWRRNWDWKGASREQGRGRGVREDREKEE